MILKNYPHNFSNNVLLLVISDCRYAPGTSKMATYLPSYVHITNVVNIGSHETVGDATDLPSFKYQLFLLPPEHVITLILPSIFFFD